MQWWAHLHMYHFLNYCDTQLQPTFHQWEAFQTPGQRGMKVLHFWMLLLFLVVCGRGRGLDPVMTLFSPYCALALATVASNLSGTQPHLAQLFSKAIYLCNQFLVVGITPMIFFSDVTLPGKIL